MLATSIQKTSTRGFYTQICYFMINLLQHKVHFQCVINEVICASVLTETCSNCTFIHGKHYLIKHYNFPHFDRKQNSSTYETSEQGQWISVNMLVISKMVKTLSHPTLIFLQYTTSLVLQHIIMFCFPICTPYVPTLFCADLALFSSFCLSNSNASALRRSISSFWAFKEPALINGLLLAEPGRS